MPRPSGPACHWTTSPQQALARTKLPEFLSSLTGSEYTNIGMTCDNGSRTPASAAVHCGGAVSLAISTTSGAASAVAVLSNVQSASPLPRGGVADPSGISSLFTAPGISQQFDNVACGWHDCTGSGANTLKFSWARPAPGCDFLSGSVALGL